MHTLLQRSGRTPATVIPLQLLKDLFHPESLLCNFQSGCCNDMCRLYRSRALIPPPRQRLGYQSGCICADLQLPFSLSDKPCKAQHKRKRYTVNMLGSPLPFTLKPAPCMSGDGDMVTGLPAQLNSNESISVIMISTLARHTKNIEVQRLLTRHDFNWLVGFRYSGHCTVYSMFAKLDKAFAAI